MTFLEHRLADDELALLRVTVAGSRQTFCARPSNPSRREGHVLFVKLAELVNDVLLGAAVKGSEDRVRHADRLKNRCEPHVAQHRLRITGRVAGCLIDLSAHRAQPALLERAPSRSEPVSYTHLTLPTIYS